MATYEELRRHIDAGMPCFPNSRSTLVARRREAIMPDSLMQQPVATTPCSSRMPPHRRTCIKGAV